jgi:hypothetical protein
MPTLLTIENVGSSTLTLPPRNGKAVLIIVAALGAALNLLVAVKNSTGWGEDFNQFYSASRLAGTGQVYNWEALRKLEDQNGQEVPTGRLPVVLFGAKLIGWLPYPLARIVWLIASVLALGIFAVVWPGVDGSWMAVALAWSMPVGLCLVLGQDTPFWLMLTALGLFLLQRGRPQLAGLVFSLCICKFHLALGIPILLAAQRRWSALLSACASGAALLAACFLIEGPAWPLRYLEASRQTSFSPAVYRMPNLNGIAYWFPWPTAVEIVLTIAVICLLWTVCRRTADLGLAGAAAAGAGLILAHHCYANDCALLIPLLAIAILRPGIPRWMKMSAVLLLSPAPVFLVTTIRPFTGQVLVVGFVVSALAVAIPAAQTTTLPLAAVE